MKSKLTLSVAPEAVKRMKRIAAKRQVSVSRLFEDWSERYAGGEDAEPPQTLGAALRGAWSKEPADQTDARLEYLLEKHVRK